MAAFRSRMGGRYASGRNFDLGPGRHKAVSCLSPYVRRRMVLEEELVDVALASHGLDGAEKFIQEVFWRGYFKGWLERRPSVWAAYRDGLLDDLMALDGDRKLSKRVAEAEEGRTGLECFDAWAEELVSTGYLHNHARMWFASIW
ncbi:MAG: FAD-binding domain-containing protein, partial [Pseudomonadota bacterium]